MRSSRGLQKVLQQKWSNLSNVWFFSLSLRSSQSIDTRFCVGMQTDSKWLSDCNNGFSRESLWQSARAEIWEGRKHAERQRQRFIYMTTWLPEGQEAQQTGQLQFITFIMGVCVRAHVSLLMPFMCRWKIFFPWTTLFWSLEFYFELSGLNGNVKELHGSACLSFVHLGTWNHVTVHRIKDITFLKKKLLFLWDVTDRRPRLTAGMNDRWQWKCFFLLVLAVRNIMAS